MVIIHTKTLERKKGVRDATAGGSLLDPHWLPAMSQGTALFSREGTDARVWADPARLLAAQRGPAGASLESLWDTLPEAGTASCVTSLLRDLRLSDGAATPSLMAAPPSKRQCRSLSCSDDPGGGGRTAWRPQGSRVWMAVEKRRCHSGGSVQRCPPVPAGGFPAMQRSSSFSLPTHANRLPELPVFSFTGEHSCPPWCPSSAEPPQPLYLSQEHIGPRGASPGSSPDSTPELGRRPGVGEGILPRSRSQPCVLNEHKVGMKRRRPEEGQEPRPSLDLAKMTQRRTFHSLSCPGFTEVNRCFSSPAPSCRNSAEHVTKRRSGLRHGAHDDSYEEELDSDSADSDELGAGMRDWTNSGVRRQDLRSTVLGADQLGGELDIEQIERN